MIPKYEVHPWGPWSIQSTIDQKFIDILLEKGNESRAKNLDNRRILAGQMDYEYYYEDFKEWFCPLFDPYMSAYQVGAMSNGRQLFKKPVIGYEMISLWINYQQAYEYNPPHNHGGDLSFVIWLQIPEEIVKEHIETKHEHNNPGPGMICFDLGPEMPLSVNRVGFLPKVGDIVIFPAWLQHHVNSFKSDVARISVSGNIKMKTFDIFQSEYDKI